MPYLVIRHKVKDYNKWKPIFDEHAATRKKYGCKGGKLYRSNGESSEVVIVSEWDDLGKAREFAQTEDLQKTMERAGVIGDPEIFFLEDSESFKV